MKPNRVKKALINNQVRSALQRWYEAPLLQPLGGRTDALQVLEIGCGRGVGTVIILSQWRKGVSEVARGLRPGGLFSFQEVTRHAVDRWSYRTFFEHPDEDRFSAEEFVTQLEGQGMLVSGNCRKRFLGDFVLGLGRKARARRNS